MKTSKRFLISVLALFLSTLWADVAEGYFLVSNSHHTSATSKINLEAMEKPDGAKESEKTATADKEKADKAQPEKERRMVPKYERAMREKEAHKKKNEEQPKYPFINLLHERLELVFGKYTEQWYHDWKVWVGVTLWLMVWVKWTVYGYDEIYYQRGLYAFGLNIMILHLLQYAETIKMGMLWVSILLGLQAILQSLLWYREDLKEKSDDLPEEWLCDTLYLDLSLPVLQIFVLFVAQCCVWWFYMTSILNNFDFNNVNYMFWLVAYLAMQMTMIFNRGGDSVLGNPFPVADVYRLFIHASKMSVEVKDADAEPFMVSKVDIIMRGLFGFLVNAIFREIMAYTIPLMLMGFDQPMDFVVYCVGVNFICTLDDMTEKEFLMKTDAHLLAAGDLVVARWPGHAGKADNPWFAGKVKEVDIERMRCTISYLDGSESEDVKESDVLYAPERDPKWGNGELRGNDMIPEGAKQVVFREIAKSAEESAIHAASEKASEKSTPRMPSREPKLERKPT